MNPFPKNGTAARVPPPPDPPEPPSPATGLVLLTLKEAAKIVGIRPQTLGEYCQAKRLPATRHGPTWILFKHDVEEFAAKPRPVGRPKGSKTKKPPAPPKPKAKPKPRRKPRREN